MFFDTVEDLHSKFKLFDRLNTIVFGVWKDKSALEYRDGSLQDLRILYMNYINEMRQQCNELEQLNKEVSDVFTDVQGKIEKIGFISANPSIEGCAAVHARGYEDYEVINGYKVYFGHTTMDFVVGPEDRGDIVHIARCKSHLYKCEAYVSQML